MPSYGFHSEAAEEYLAATRYYLDNASPLVAAAFVAEIEAAIQTLLASPTIWQIIESLRFAVTCSDAFRIQFIIDGSRNRKEFQFTPSCTSANYLVTGVSASDQ